MLEIDGIYIVDKHGTFVQLKKSDDKNNVETIDYFKFESSLFQHFEVDTIKKITEYLNEGKKVLIDFDKEKAMLIKDKDPNFMSIFKSEFDPQTVAAFYEENGGNTLDDNYQKPNLGEQKNDTKPIY